LYSPLITRTNTRNTPPPPPPPPPTTTTGSVWSPHHPVDNSVLEGQLELIGSASINMNNRIDADATFNTLCHHQLLPVDPHFL